MGNSIKLTDVKKLWSRSGNRCAFADCRVELFTEGDKAALGEMAHIVAQSQGGPRWDPNFPPDEIDSYTNLILLCPNHHTIIDKTSPDEYSVGRLHKIKQEHEQWVSKQLSAGTISIRPVDNSAFIAERKRIWADFSRGRVWIITSITPLTLEDDVLDPVSSKLKDVINKVELPYKDGWLSANPVVNFTYTRPNEHGLVNDDLRYLDQEEKGHRLEVFRNGHCEFLICLEGSIKHTTSFGTGRSEGCDKVLHYLTLAECVEKQLAALRAIWVSVVPVNDMVLTATLVNTRDTCLFGESRTWDHVIGARVEANAVEYSTVVNKDLPLEQWEELVLKRLSNCFGLVLTAVRDASGKLVRPSRM